MGHVETCVIWGDDPETRLRLGAGAPGTSGHSLQGTAAQAAVPISSSRDRIEMAPTRGAAAVPCFLPRDGRVLVRSGRGKGEELHSPAADVDVDGLVDGRDLAILAARFGNSP